MSRIQSDAGVGRRGPRGKFTPVAGNQLVAVISVDDQELLPGDGHVGPGKSSGKPTEREPRLRVVSTHTCRHDGYAMCGRTGLGLHRSLKPRGRSAVSFPPTVQPFTESWAEVPPSRPRESPDGRPVATAMMTQ